MPLDALNGQFAFESDVLQRLFIELVVGLHFGNHAVFALRRDAGCVEGGFGVARRGAQQIAHASQTEDDDSRADAADQQPTVDAARKSRRCDSSFPQSDGDSIAQNRQSAC